MKFNHQSFKNKKYLFFDFDGVIVESLNIKSEGFAELYKYLNKAENKEIVEHHIKYSGVSRYEKIKYYHKKYLNIKLNKKQLDLECNKFSKIILKKMFKVKYVYGVKKFIYTLKKNHKIFLLSATPQNELESILKNKDINNFFVYIGGSPKNKTFHIKKIIKKERIETNKSLYFGDSLSDYNVAKKFNFEFILRQHSLNFDIFQNINCNKIMNFSNFF